MKTLKIAAFGIVVASATALLALVLGVPAGPVVGPVQNRVEADTGYRLRIVGNSTVAFWPSPTVTVRDISLFDATDADPLGNLTAESMRFSMTLSSLFAGYVRIGEIAIARPVLRVPLLRQRSTPTGGASARSGSDTSVSAKDFLVDRVTIEDGTVVLSSARDHFESQFNGIGLTASLSGRDGYERGANLVTSNLPFNERTSIFGSERLTGASHDWLTHHVHILETNGESYRLATSKKAQRRSAQGLSQNPNNAKRRRPPPICKSARKHENKPRFTALYVLTRLVHFHAALWHILSPPSTPGLLDRPRRPLSRGFAPVSYPS